MSIIPAILIICAIMLPIVLLLAYTLGFSIREQNYLEEITLIKHDLMTLPVTPENKARIASRFDYVFSNDLDKDTSYALWMDFVAKYKELLD